jgi:ComF family protein
VLEAVLELLFPRRCAGCARGPWPFCDACRGRIVVLTSPSCATCGRPMEEEVASCRDCPPRLVGWARAPFLYEGPVRTALHRLKFQGWRGVAQALGAAMAPMACARTDCVTWVPLSRRRRATRGYDQARALAVAVSTELGVQARALLRRTRDTPAQARRSGQERRRAMHRAFRYCGPDPPPRRVMLVDDVLTTGATAAECARVLRGAGVHEVGLLTAARAFSGPLPARCYTAADSRPGLWLPGDRPR